MNLFNLSYNRPSSFKEQARKFRMGLNQNFTEECRESFDFDSLCQAFAPANFDRVFHGVSRGVVCEKQRTDIQELLEAFKPVSVEYDGGANIGFASLLLRDNETAFISHLES